MYTAISRKVVGKSACDNPERYCGWFWVCCSSKKFERMVREGPREAMDVCLRMLKEAWKEILTATVSGTVYWSYPILPFGIVACTFLPTTFLEIAVQVKMNAARLQLAGIHARSTQWARFACDEIINTLRPAFFEELKFSKGFIKYSYLQIQ